VSPESCCAVFCSKPTVGRGGVGGGGTKQMRGPPEPFNSCRLECANCVNCPALRFTCRNAPWAGYGGSLRSHNGKPYTRRGPPTSPRKHGVGPASSPKTAHWERTHACHTRTVPLSDALQIRLHLVADVDHMHVQLVAQVTPERRGNRSVAFRDAEGDTVGQAMGQHDRDRDLAIL